MFRKPKLYCFILVRVVYIEELQMKSQCQVENFILFYCVSLFSFPEAFIKNPYI